MKSDNSRNTFDPRKRYSGVIMQQGRVQLDADWNEQIAIQQHRTEMESVDVIGGGGIPEQGGGFAIHFTPDYTDLTISAGRMYVDGLLCENMVGSHVPFTIVGTDQVQVDSISVDGRAFRKGEWVELSFSDGHTGGMFQIIAVDTDKRLLTLRVDDTLFKLSDYQQAKVHHLRRIMTYTTQPDYPYPDYAIHTSDADLSQLQLHADHVVLLVYLDMWERHITALDDPAIREVALGGPDTTTRIQNVAQVRILPIDIAAEFPQLLEARKDPSKQEEKAHDEALQKFARSLTSNSELRKWNERIRPSTGKLEARLRPTPPGISAYSRLENQLYRVEIHSVDTKTGRTQFKWSRDNGSVATAIKEIKENTVLVQGVGPNSIGDFQRGQWVEVTSDLNELKSQPGHVTQISDVDPVSGALVLEESSPDIALQWHPKLLRWDGGDAFQSQGGTFDLEGGIEIRFSEGTYMPGDYWQIPARTATGEIEWPYTLPQPPRGVKHHYARLALIHLYKDEPDVVQDCRRWFSPIASHAMRVIYTNWLHNGDHGRDLLKDGLLIKLDTAPDPYSISPATMIVSVETTLPGGSDGQFIMNGSIEVEDNRIYWRWKGKEEGTIAEYLDKFNILRASHKLLGGEHSSLRPLVRVTLKGHHIWGSYNGRRIYLDGETYTEPEGVVDGEEHLNVLRFPTGGGSKAHDFESWFYLTEL